MQRERVKGMAQGGKINPKVGKRSYSAAPIIKRIVSIQKRLHTSNRIILFIFVGFLVIATVTPALVPLVPLNIIQVIPIPGVANTGLALCISWFAISTYWKKEADWLTCESGIEASRNLERMFANLEVTPENDQKFGQASKRIFEEMTAGLTSPMRIRLTGGISPLTQFLSDRKEDDDDVEEKSS
jgi:hypothetical protein